MPLTISVENLLTWNDATTQHWRDFFHANPLQLLLPCDIRNSKTIADTLQHIVAVELRYAQRLAGLPESSYEEIPKNSIDTLLTAHTLAFDLLRSLLASRETILVHLTLHSIRHYAQLATLVRQQGFKTNWPMDYLFTAAQRA